MFSPSDLSPLTLDRGTQWLVWWQYVSYAGIAFIGIPCGALLALCGKTTTNRVQGAGYFLGGLFALFIWHWMKG